jgi:hypothetical protein
LICWIETGHPANFGMIDSVLTIAEFRGAIPQADRRQVAEIGAMTDEGD